MIRLKVVDKLVLQELISPFFFGIMMFTALFFAGTNLFSIAEYMVKGASPALITKLILLSLPAVIVKTFPMGMLLASLLAFGRFSGESELVAIYASGYSLKRIMMPVAIFGLAVSMVAMLFYEYAVPKATAEMWRLKTAIIKQVGDRTRAVNQTVLEDGKIRTNIVAQGGVDLEAGLLYDVTVTQYAPVNGRWLPQFTVVAQRAKWISGIEWNLENGYWETADGKVRVDFAYTSTRELKAGVNKSLQQLEEDLVPDPDARSFKETLRRIRKYNKAGEDTSKLLVELLNKISLPLASFIFGIVGAPLAIRRQRASAAAGFATSIVVIFLYWTLYEYLYILGKDGTMHPVLAAFLPDFLGLVAAIYFLKQKSR